MVSDVPQVKINGPEEAPKARKPWVVIAVGAVLGLGIAGGALWSALGSDDSVEPAAEQVTAVESLGIEGLRYYSGLTARHTTDDVAYEQSPAVGGDHAPQWLACGVYAEPVREENAVHNLEHGTVWVGYQPGLSAGDIDQLAKMLPENGIMAPYPGLDSKIVMTVWGFQLMVDKADDPRLDEFLLRFGNSQATLEPGASCLGGTRDPSAGSEPQGTAV